MTGQTLLSPRYIQCLTLCFVGFSSNRIKSLGLSSGTMTKDAPGMLSSSKNRRTEAGSNPRASSCVRRCWISSMIKRTMGSESFQVRSLLGSVWWNSDRRKGAMYGRAWEIIKWLTLNNSPIRVRGASRSL
jgi:hypothetical protein